MLNQVVVVGRLVRTPEVDINDDKKICNITIATPRSYKNENEEYETDFIDAVLYGNIAESTCEYCHKGDLIGIKGRLQKEGSNVSLKLVAEKISFLSANGERSG